MGKMGPICHFPCLCLLAYGVFESPSFHSRGSRGFLEILEFDVF